MNPTETLDAVIESLEKKASSTRVPYSARLVMGTKGNLDGLKNRLPKEFPGEEQAIGRIDRLIDSLITELEGLIGRNKDAGNQSPQAIQQELESEAARRAQGQLGANRC